MEPVDVALHEAAIETKPSFAACATPSITKLIADIAGDIERAAGSLSSRG